MKNLHDKEAEKADSHLLLSEKYMAYKDLAERCVITATNNAEDNDDHRVFYMKPKSPFLDEPRKQNTYRNEFVSKIGQAPAPEPLTYLADDLHKAYIEQTMDRSNPAAVKEELCQFFRRRQYKLQHKRYKLLLRWAHYCLASEQVDKVALKFNPIYAKVQFELENAVKRHQRLEGEDHFRTPDRPEQKPGSSYIDIYDGVRPPFSSLRADDIDVYLRMVTFEEQITRKANRFVQRVKWTPCSHRFEIYEDSIQAFQNMRNASIQSQEDHIELIQEKGTALIDLKKLGDEGRQELNQIIQSKNVKKLEKRNKNARDRIMGTCKYNYELPPMVFWNEVELKIRLNELATQFKVSGNMDTDNGHNFSYQVITYFPQTFQHQVVKNQFAPYDAIPSLIDPANLAKKDIKKVLRRNQKKYGRTQGANTLLEVLEIQKNSKEMGVEFLNSVEKSLFGEFNNAQFPDHPSVRVKDSDWVEYICFKPNLDHDQMYQAAVLSGEKNWIDECLANMLEILNVQDMQNVNLIMESISQMHYDKVKYGSVKTDFLNFDPNDADTFFTEDQKQFLSLYRGCLKSKADFDQNKPSVDLPAVSLHEIPQHLLFANYLLQTLNAREEKTKLLYTMNSFRSIQRRLTTELREMGTRDRVLGDAQLVRPMEQRAECPISDGDETDKSDLLQQSAGGDGSQEGDRNDPQKHHLLDINQYRFNGKLQNYLHSTCPIVPKFHSTFGQPIERQEVSQEVDRGRDTDAEKQSSKKLLGRVDRLYKHVASGLNLVKDDFGIHILYNAAFIDMRAMEQEILKICSFYINKAEPLLDNDLRNCYPSVDRLKILDEALQYENLYQEQKLDLVTAYLECFEHTSDILEQQRLIQAIVDEMARRPKLNLSGAHFKDSYLAEIECTREKVALIRRLTTMLIKDEQEENASVKGYLEKCYRMINDQVHNKWHYVAPEDKEKYLNVQELVKTGEAGLRDNKNDMLLRSETGDDRRREVDAMELEQRKLQTQSQATEPSATYHFANVKEFALARGIKIEDLEVLMFEHHERDHLVRQSIHEHIGFIKTSEGYPQFLTQNATVQNSFKFTPQSVAIGVLDFYESLSIMPKVIAAIQGAVQDCVDCHKPDNGLLTTLLEKSVYKYLSAELSVVESHESRYIEKSQGLRYLDDNSVVGNADKMLFFSKELAASSKDQRQAQNPFVVGKLDMEELKKVNWAGYQGYIKAQDQLGGGSKGKEQGEPSITKKSWSQFHAKLQERSEDLKYPTMLKLCCNATEVLRLRNTLLQTLEQTNVLEDVYDKQTRLLGRETGQLYSKEDYGMQSFVNGGEFFINFVDEGPANEVPIKLAINEYSKSLRSCLNFSDSECFKAMILPLGLEELRAVVAYEVMNLQGLIVAVKTNQIQTDNSQRQLSEIEFFRLGFTVANPVFNLFELLQGSNLFESNLKKLPATEKSGVKSHLSSKVSEGYYRLKSRKQAMKEEAKKQFQIVKNATGALKDQPWCVAQRQLRTLKIVMCHDVCQDSLARIYYDSVKLQILHETDSLRRRVYMLPRDSTFLELFPPRNGEHMFAAYNEDHQEQHMGVGKDRPLFFNQADGRIQSFLRLPGNHEVINIDFDIQKFKEVNMPKNLVYQAGKLSENVLPEYCCDNSLEKIQAKIQQLTLVESCDVESIQQDRQRLVEFAEAYDYSAGGNAVKYLRYFKAISNIFDLEFFTNKLASSAQSIANVEKMVLSGVPFYEESDDALFGNMDDEESAAEEGKPTTPKEQKRSLKPGEKRKPNEVHKFDEEGHKPLKNILALKVANKIADEKREKMQLIQDLESIKDKFVEYENMLKRQELRGFFDDAATFLNDIHTISYYGVLYTLYQMQDKYYTDKKGQKEIHFINEVVQGLSHQQDLKVTYLNGFHVNYAITALDRLDIDANPYKQEYDSFFKVTQPIIDEEALNPAEFNLISGIYMANSINLQTFKKNIPYMGHINHRDYKCLDFALCNLSKEIRKYITTNLNSVDLTLQGYIQDKLKISEKDQKEASPKVHPQIRQEKKNFLKCQIKARQLKRIFTMVTSKRMLPTQIEEYNKDFEEARQAINWKVSAQMDQITKVRAAVQTREKLAVESKRLNNPAGEIALSLKPLKESPALGLYDGASSVIEVIQQELKNYMIKVAARMFDSETNALAKAFEMSNLRLQAFVHPSQQFASTFHVNVDGRNHLDIINKVSPIQKMLTQIKNRCLEIQTLTSGTGIVISSKDLNECLEECCRSLIKYGEIEMRTRCEYLSMNLIQYENLLYIKDRQLLNLEGKLRTAKTEMNKIVNTKVFSRGNNLIYELDMSTRQLRMLKDNIFLMERNLTEKIKLCYDTDLDQSRMLLADYKKQLLEGRQKLSSDVKRDVRVIQNEIDEVMKKKVLTYRELDRKTPNQQALEEYQKNMVNVSNTTINIENIVISKKDGSIGQKGPTDPNTEYEMNILKKNEKEARDEVQQLYDVITKQRMLFKFKELLTAQRHEYKIDNLKQQLTSNTTLWEQLAEGEKREKILKQEIERAQQEIATQEKIIERLKDDIKKEGREKQKLLQYKNTKSKRLDELETKAREFEVLSSVNLSKILSLLESKEKKINSLSANEDNMNEMITAMRRINDKEILDVKRRAKEETKVKMEAMTKLEGLRQELQTIQGNTENQSQTASVHFWKDQCQNLFDICRNLKEDNEKLVDHIGVYPDNSGSGMFNHDMDNEQYSRDHIQANREVLNHLNSTPNGAQGNGYLMNQQASGLSGPGHRRNHSQQAPMPEQQTQHQRQSQHDYEMAMYGMDQGLQEHMLGTGSKRDPLGASYRNGAGRVGGSSKNSFGSEQKDVMSQHMIDATRFQLPQIKKGGRNPGANQYMTEQSVIMGGNVAANRFSLGQQGPFVGKMGHDLDSIQSSAYGKMTPMYEKQFSSVQQKANYNVFKGPPHAGSNVFTSLNGGGPSQDHHSLDPQGNNQMSVVITGGQISDNSKGNNNTSVNITNISTNRSPRQKNSLDEGNAFASQDASQGGNIFNFQPQTQRTNINLDGGLEHGSQQDSLIQDLAANFDGKKHSVGQFGDASQSASKGGIAGRATDKKKQKVLQTTLQPKLIMPPQKLQRTLDHQGARAAPTKKKQPAPQPQYF